MKKFLVTGGVVLLLGSFSFLSGNKKVFKKLYALEGTWRMKIKKGFLFEEWERIDKNYLQNRSYVVKDADTIITESVALTRTKEDIYYTPTVEDQNDKKAIPFTLTSATGHVFIFENPEHDFPKRIVYHLVSSDSLHAWADDGLRGVKKVQHFYYSKQNK